MNTTNNSITKPKIDDLGAIREDPALEKVLRRISSIKSLRAISLFPDLFYKPKNESPASMATATKGTIVPNLTSPTLGCSMGIIKTNLVKSDITEEFQDSFYQFIQDDLGRDYGVLENVLTWLGLKKRPLLKHDLTLPEFDDVIRRGAEAGVDRYNLPKSILDNLESRGSVFTKEEQDNLNIKKILPRSSFTNGRHNLGYGFKGNHFLELQVVEKIFDQEIAHKLGLKKDQVVIKYHGGGGLIPYHVGRYYANRDKKLMGKGFFVSRSKLILHFLGKLVFHIFSIDGLLNLGLRLKYYFLPSPFQEIPLDSAEGKRVFNATKASINYSYAFNMAILRRVMDALEKTKHGIQSELVVAKMHNIILEEEVKGEKLIVHRHTTTKVRKGSLSIISGFNNTKGYLIKGLEGSTEHLNSADHGSGHVIKNMINKGISKKHPKGHKTVIYRTKEPYKKIVEHVTGEGIDYVADQLEKYNITTRAIQLRPIASFKG